MAISPFGEKFRLRTGLSEQQCRDRINEFAEPSQWDPDYRAEPHAVCVRRWIKVWEQGAARGPELTAKLRRVDGATEINGRAGSNMFLFFILLGTSALLLAGMIADPELADPLWLKIPFAIGGPWLLYLLYRYDPDAGHLIVFLEEILEANNLSRPRSLNSSRARERGALP